MWSRPRCVCVCVPAISTKLSPCFDEAIGMIRVCTVACWRACAWLLLGRLRADLCAGTARASSVHPLLLPSRALQNNFVICTRMAWSGMSSDNSLGGNTSSLTFVFFLFFIPLLFLSSAPLAHILHYDYFDNPTGVTIGGGGLAPPCGTCSCRPGCTYVWQRACCSTTNQRHETHHPTKTRLHTFPRKLH